jgi:hypothetical protein
MNEARTPEKPGAIAVTIVAGIALAGVSGAIWGYLLVGTTQGTLWSALAIGFFAGKNAVISALKPAFALALGIGLAGGFLGGVCAVEVFRHTKDLPGWVGGIAGAAIGGSEVFLWWWKRKDSHESSGRAPEAAQGPPADRPRD